MPSSTTRRRRDWTCENSGGSGVAPLGPRPDLADCPGTATVCVAVHRSGWHGKCLTHYQAAVRQAEVQQAGTTLSQARQHFVGGRARRPNHYRRSDAGRRYPVCRSNCERSLCLQHRPTAANSTAQEQRMPSRSPRKGPRSLLTSTRRCCRAFHRPRRIDGRWRRFPAAGQEPCALHALSLHSSSIGRQQTEPTQEHAIEAKIAIKY